jgi:hypothetical protein
LLHVEELKDKKEWEDFLHVSFMNDRIRRSFGSQSGYVDTSTGTVEIDLDATPSHFIWNSLFSKNRRWKIKRFEKEGYHAEQAQTKSDLKDFYGLYYENMKYIGARPYPYDFLENMWNLLYPLNLRLWLVARDEAIGGILVLKDSRSTYWLLAGIDRRRAYAHYPTVNYLLWKEIQTAESEGYRRVSFGATSSDPRDAHYLQKVSFGGSFNQQKTIRYPCSHIGWALLKARAGALSSLRPIQRFLPIRFKRFLERRVQRSH